jgi:hypothetical protein
MGRSLHRLPGKGLFLQAAKHLFARAWQARGGRPDVDWVRKGVQAYATFRHARAYLSLIYFCKKFSPIGWIFQNKTKNFFFSSDIFNKNRFFQRQHLRGYAKARKLTSYAKFFGVIFDTVIGRPFSYYHKGLCVYNHAAWWQK